MPIDPESTEFDLVLNSTKCHSKKIKVSIRAGKQQGLELFEGKGLHSGNYDVQNCGKRLSSIGDP
jgi:hypothetical protein